MASASCMQRESHHLLWKKIRKRETPAGEQAKGDSADFSMSTKEAPGMTAASE
ncbi:hypothetical protein St703_22630 [Sporolactobacillus terrae]|uniref:Uncharacterized protein n=1 Tax=Sporolactobacillus terrae TaxID=269673 RepID=A0A5K7X3Q0_9BACL|nr:hypothetical protein St703_22630 [Sporolactobacillus terrae]